VISLRDGRDLGFASFGDPDGVPCFGFHGIPGSRFEGAFFHDAAYATGVRLIEVDRPGIGLSSPSADRSVASIAADVSELADVLGIERFAVFGWSGGGPYALACAALLPDRVLVTIVASTPAPPDDNSPTWAQLTGFRRHLWRLGTRRSWPLVPAMWLVAKTLWLLRPVVRRAYQRQPVALRPPEATVEGMYEAWSQGARYVARDLHAVANDWGFQLAKIDGDVHLWHGLDDRAVPVGMGRSLAAQIKNAHPHFVPGGHRVCVERAADVFAPVRTAVGA
jgi:pimeloyl-ACP methyl ester carboxylesterase